MFIKLFCCIFDEYLGEHNDKEYSNISLVFYNKK